MTPGETNRNIGKRGEILFQELITQWCDEKPWFRVLFLGNDAVALDFIVGLENPTLLDACCWVSVKATRCTKYSGKGASRKLLVRVTKQDIDRLRKNLMPTYVVGIDIDSECGFIKRITAAQKKGFTGISAHSRFRLNCRSIKKLWSEVNCNGSA